MRDEVLRRDALRLAYLKRLWEVSGGNTRGGIQIDEIGHELGLNRQETAQVVRYLIDEGLAHWFGAGGFVGITHEGVREVEDTLRTPTRGSEHFSPTVIAETVIIAGEINNSQIPIRSPNAQQIVAPVDVAALQAAVDGLRAITRAVRLDDESQEQVDADLATAEAQLKSPRPHFAIVRTVLASVLRVVEGAIGGAVAPEIAEQLQRVHELIAHLPT